MVLLIIFQIDKDGSVFSFGNSFYTGDLPAENPLKKRDHIDPVAALQGVTKVLSLPIEADAATAEEETAPNHFVIGGTEGAQSDPKARLVYFQRDGALDLTWRVETDILDDWLLSYVDAETGSKISGVVNYVADAQYQV
jgi:extracellular elastinolytic metalloproteinase